MKYADCQIALIYDPVNHAAANIHSGWRGSVANIFQEAILGMQQNYGSHPSNLLVCISPSLGPDEAEFIHYRKELPEPFWDYQVRPTYFDFWSITEAQLQAAGILPHHIEIARISTHANSKDFFPIGGIKSQAVMLPALLCYSCFIKAHHKVKFFLIIGRMIL